MASSISTEQLAAQLVKNSASLPPKFMAGSDATIQQSSGFFNSEEWKQLSDALNLKGQQAIDQAKVTADATVKVADLNSQRELEASLASTAAQKELGQYTADSNVKGQQITADANVKGQQITADANLKGQELISQANKDIAQAQKEGLLGSTQIKADSDLESSKVQANAQVGVADTTGKWGQMMAQTQADANVKGKEIEAQAGLESTRIQGETMLGVEGKRAESAEKIANIGILNTKEQGNQQRLGIEAQAQADMKKANNDLANLFSKYGNERAAASNLYTGRLT